MDLIRRWSLPALAAILLVLGVRLVSQPYTIAWAAYAPLSDSVFTPRPWQHAVGLLLLLADVALGAGWIGYRLGRRRPRT